jgi:riboflavin biosynthesis pyrimidine reductase
MHPGAKSRQRAQQPDRVASRAMQPPMVAHGSLIAVRRLYPTYAEDVDLLASYAYPEMPFGGRWLRANMITSVDGAATDAHGSSRGLASTADRRLLVALRGMSDVILAGGTTVRREAYKRSRPREEVVRWRQSRGLSPAPRLAVVSANLDFDYRSELFQADHGPVPIVVTTADAPSLRLATVQELVEVIVAGSGRVDLGLAVAALAERGLMRILCEGGPRLLGQLADAWLLDELCVTVAPTLAGRPDAPNIMSWPRARHELVPLRLTDVFEDGGYLFTRYGRP